MRVPAAQHSRSGRKVIRDPEVPAKKKASAIALASFACFELLTRDSDSVACELLPIRTERATRPGRSYHRRWKYAVVAVAV